MAYYESARDLDNSISALYHWASSGSSWVGSTNKTFNQLTISASPNFPPNSSATRYILNLPGEICSTNFTNFPFNVKNINTTTILTRVEYNQTLTANTFKVFPSTCSTPERIEIHVGTGSNQAGNTLDWDGYFIGSMLSSTFALSIESTDAIPNSFFYPKVINIGGWNMNATDYVDILHGISSTFFFILDVQIFDDAGTYRYCLNRFSNNTDPNLLDGGVGVIASSYIRLSRRTGGDFDGVSDFDSTAVNRGFIFLGYIK